MKFLAIFGNPISHSKSPRMHNNAIKSLGLDAIYTRYLLNDEKLLKEKLLSLKLSGANITVPFKNEALKIADFKDDMAVKIGSANTLIIGENGKISAYNTDAPGFLQSISTFKNIKKALILGAGGTSKALAFALLDKGVEVFVANRSKERLKEFSFCQNSLYSDLNEKKFDIVINSTSVGLKDDTLPCDEALLKELLRESKYAFDVIYGKETPFIKLCKNFNLQYKDGLEMLLWQGVFAFELFFNIKNKQELIKKYMLEALNL